MFVWVPSASPPILSVEFWDILYRCISRANGEAPVSQIHSPHLHVGAPGIFSDDKEKVVCGKQKEATASIQSLVKLQRWFTECAVEGLSSAEVQPSTYNILFKF